LPRRSHVHKQRRIRKIGKSSFALVPVTGHRD
jgi:hypothetical protein